jgi:hypothetical protein
MILPLRPSCSHSFSLSLTFTLILYLLLLLPHHLHPPHLLNNTHPLRYQNPFQQQNTYIINILRHQSARSLELLTQPPVGIQLGRSGGGCLISRRGAGGSAWVSKIEPAVDVALGNLEPSMSFNLMENKWID